MKKETLVKIVKQYESLFWDIGTKLFECPELSGEEYASSAFLKEVLKEHGFVVESDFQGLPTAFRATYPAESKGTGPVIAFLAEYDALPGYGKDKKPAHACGHNWIAACSCGAAIALSKAALIGTPTIQVIGTPSEETTGSKVDMIRMGVFDAVDLVMQLHPENQTMIETRTLAMDAIEFEFEGKAAHAAQCPHEGINALDAVQLTFAGINAYRQHVRPDVRIHGIVTHGGDAPNIVPAGAACRFYVRATDRMTLDRVTQRVIRCAEGASLMTGSGLKHRFFENPFDDLVHVTGLKSLLKNNMIWAGIDDIQEEPEAMPGSSDIGNVSHIIPTAYANIRVSHGPSVHDEAFLEHLVSDYSRSQLEKAVLALAGTAYDAIENGMQLKVIQEEFRQIRQRTFE